MSMLSRSLEYSDKLLSLGPAVALPDVRLAPRVLVCARTRTRCGEKKR